MPNLIQVCPNTPCRHDHQPEILLRPLFHVSTIPQQVQEFKAAIHDVIFVNPHLIPHLLSSMALPEQMTCCFLCFSSHLAYAVRSYLMTIQVSFRGQDISACPPREILDFVWYLQAPNELPEFFHTRSVRAFLK